MLMKINNFLIHKAKAHYHQLLLRQSGPLIIRRTTRKGCLPHQVSHPSDCGLILTTSLQVTIMIKRSSIDYWLMAILLSGSWTHQGWIMHRTFELTRRCFYIWHVKVNGDLPRFKLPLLRSIRGFSLPFWRPLGRSIRGVRISITLREPLSIPLIFSFPYPKTYSSLSTSPKS